MPGSHLCRSASSVLAVLALAVPASAEVRLQTAGAVLKYSEDLQAVRATGFASLAPGTVLTPGGGEGARPGKPGG